VVLIVEDEFLLRMNAAEMIGEAGFEVVEAANADQAIAILEARPDIHVVFTDIQTGFHGRAEARQICQRTMATDQDPCDLRLRQRRESRFAGRQSLSDQALPAGANRRHPSRVDQRRMNLRDAAISHGTLNAGFGLGCRAWYRSI
jgi:CheY-like chemotaxis protein